MKITKTIFKGVIIIEPEIYKDNRGAFKEVFNKQEFKKHQLPYLFVQDNQSISRKGVIRGIHYQKGKFAQGKLVTVNRGAVNDIIVDLNKKSKMFGKYIMIKLTEDNNKLIYIPPGYGHGFISLIDNTLFSYKVTKQYNPKAEGGIVWNDPNINIDWGLKYLNIEQPIISHKDLKLQTLLQYKNENN